MNEAYSVKYCDPYVYYLLSSAPSYLGTLVQGWHTLQLAANEFLTVPHMHTTTAQKCWLCWTHQMESPLSNAVLQAPEIFVISRISLAQVGSTPM